ncbi:MAG: acetyl-CoA hydrolase/transferase C-terminal domain-containing protein [Marmoricola sp.]
MTIAKQHKMVAIAQAFAIDLTGQVCIDQFNGEFYSGIGCQGEFLLGAAQSPGGKPIHLHDLHHRRWPDLARARRPCWRPSPLPLPAPTCITS